MPRQSTKVARVCDTCGATFWVYPATLRQYPALYCSVPCRAAPKHPVMYVGGDVAYVPLCTRDGQTIRAYAKIDAADGDTIGQSRWHLSGGYARRTDRSGDAMKTVRMHRDILGLTDEREGDHIDRDRLNNRRGNLRPATRPANMQNKTPYRGAVSAHRGVTFDPRWGGRWYAKIRVGGRTTFLGSFDDEHTAALAAQEARARLMPFATD